MITKNWTPSENVYEVLSMGNIKKEFVDSKLPEFRLYWMEKNVAKDDWNHKFVNFIKHHVSLLNCPDFPPSFKFNFTSEIIIDLSKYLHISYIVSKDT